MSWFEILQQFILFFKKEQLVKIKNVLGNQKIVVHFGI